MATYTLPASGGVHPTLTSTTADIVTGNSDEDEQQLEVMNRGTGVIFVRRDGVTAVALASGTVAIPSGQWVRFAFSPNLSIVGNGDAYSVTRV